MIFIFGNRLFGKVDEVPGLGHVATKYFHIDYLPLFPTESWFVLEQNGNQWRGVRIPLSAKSVLIGWGRAISLLCGVIAPIVAIATSGNGRLEVAPALLAAFAWGFFIFTKTYGGITKASYARALQLAEHIGMTGAAWRNWPARTARPRRRSASSP